MEAAQTGIGGSEPDALLVAASAALGNRALGELVSRVADGADCGAWLGASAEGLLLADQEIVGLPGFAVAALSGIRAEPFSCENLAGREIEAGDEIADQLSAKPEAGDRLIDLLRQRYVPAFLGIGQAHHDQGGSTIRYRT